MVDSRNWELMPSIGGKRTRVQDMEHLRLREETHEGIVFKLAVERAVQSYLAGSEFEVPDIDTGKVSGQTNGSDVTDTARLA